MTNNDKRAPGGSGKLSTSSSSAPTRRVTAPPQSCRRQNKLSVACIDEWKNRDGSHAFGGTCLNAGCIPSKALLESSELYHRLQEEFPVHGIKVSDAAVDLTQMQKRKGGVVRAMTQGIVALFKAAGVTGLNCHGRLLSGRKVELTAPDGTRRVLSARHVVLASGSEPIELRSAPFKAPSIVDSWGALDFEAVPKRLGVIGAGVIGLELGSVWRRLGAEVIVLEALPDFLAFADQQLAREALRHFKKQGLDIRLGAKVSAAALSCATVEVTYESDAQGERSSISVDRLCGRDRAAHRLPAICLAPTRACSSMSAASSRWTIPAAPAWRACGRSGIACAGRCSPTRARKRARWSPT